MNIEYTDIRSTLVIGGFLLCLVGLYYLLSLVLESFVSKEYPSDAYGVVADYLSEKYLPFEIALQAYGVKFSHTYKGVCVYKSKVSDHYYLYFNYKGTVNDMVKVYLSVNKEHDVHNATSVEYIHKLIDDNCMLGHNSKTMNRPTVNDIINADNIPTDIKLKIQNDLELPVYGYRVDTNFRLFAWYDAFCIKLLDQYNDVHK